MHSPCAETKLQVDQIKDNIVANLYNPFFILKITDFKFKMTIKFRLK